MSCFQSKSTASTSAPLDSSKHVNYAVGMVLGVDDFNQEFAYLSGRDQWLARDLLGYGTVCGLRVSVETDVKGPRVAVAPGAALNPQGQLIRVTSPQCAYLNDWLVKHKQEVIDYLGSPPDGIIHLSVVLCYRECPIDPVPIPGEPCREIEESMASSRIMDDFKLELSWQAPDQREEDAIRDFIVWLRQIEISDAPGDATLEEFIQAIRNSAGAIGSPPDFMYGSPPASLHIHPANICEYLRVGFRVWTTELRPQWRGQSKCGTWIPDEECVLLAQITIPIKFWSGNWLVDSAGTVMVNEEKRPYLIHLRMLQEWLLCSWKGSTSSPANSVVAEQQFGLSDNPGISVEYSRADHTHGTPPEPVLDGEVTGIIGDTRVAKILEVPVIVPLSPPNPPQEGDVLTIQSGNWQAAPLPLFAGDSVKSETTFGQAVDKGMAAQFSRVDHTHGTPPDPIPAHKADPNAHDLKGEITGFIGKTKVAMIQEISVAPTIPPGPGTNEGKVLTIRNNQWQAIRPSRLAAMDVTELPTGTARYQVAAAGIVKGTESDASSSYQKLTVKATAVSRLMITFDGYKKPDASFKYIVKMLAVTNDQVKMPIITFDSYQSRGIMMNVTDGANAISKEILNQLEFMIEVSRFEP